MGNHKSRGVAKETAPHRSSIVPNEDPLLRSLGDKGGRIVRAELNRDFRILPQVLGTGYSGAVHLAEMEGSEQKVAVKQFAKRRLKGNRLQLLQSEVEVYLRLDHPNICRLLHCYEGRRDVWLVMELCACELYGRLAERKAYTESDAADLTLQMLQAVNYLHSHQIVHRDLKLENWMCSSQDDDRLKLIDFGFSRMLARDGETLDMPCGTIHYTSPEVLKRSYTSKCDMWSVGVITYMLLMGRPPFRGSNNMAIAKSIMHGDFYQEGRWLKLSTDSRDFIQQLLCKDESKRLNAADALSHRWVTGAAKGGDALRSFGAADEVGTEVLKSLRQFAQGSHLRRAALTMLAYSLTSKELEDVEQTFLAFDSHGNGTVTLEQLAEVMREHCGEVSSQEVQRIFTSLDFAQSDELHYTPFIAAMLASKVQQNEDKVRTAFEAFDHGGKGFITADGLVELFSQMQGKTGTHGLTRVEAESWIKEVDFKGNGCVDFEGFMAALTGRHLWALPTPQELDELPTVRVFDKEGTRSPGRARSFSDSWSASRSSRDGEALHRRLAGALIRDAEVAAFHHSPLSIRDAEEAEEQRCAQSFTPGTTGAAEAVQVSTTSCKIDERYFE